MIDVRGSRHNLLTASDAAEKLGRGEITSVELVEDCLARIAEREADIHAWAYVDPAAALLQARMRDAEPRRSALHGVPIGIKDIFDTCDMPTAYGSSAYAGHRPANDAAAVALMRRAGLVILGKCTTTEFACPIPVGVRNPHDFQRSPGVSSSGSAAAVADFMTPLALGSQTGGSTILPASFCGVFGFKASLTGIDRGGIRHLRPTLDTMGLFARSMADIALLDAVLTGCAPVPPPSNVHGLRIGLCRTASWSEALPETVAAIEDAIRLLSGAGARIIDAELPPVFSGLADSHRVISSFEGARAMAVEIRDYLGTMNPRNQETARDAKAITAAQYETAQLHAIACQRALAATFEGCDVLLTPSTCGEATDDLTGVSKSVFNRNWTLLHTPCANIPAFAGPHGLPVGIQVVGPVGSDARTIALTQAIAGALAP
jgi:Asp-tRNA(Asn)/Glu-tRNA(Gln) amidotransferase A subunit family amidase